MSEIVNVKVKYIRPEYDNLKEWCEDSNNCYIGRRGIVIINGRRYPEEASIFANPYKGDREEIIKKYSDVFILACFTY